jgi:peptidyl-dipeptidase Dcp
VLISLDDAETLFHEFGHALHGLLSEVNYPGLATTPRDFVEYPSQVHEMWVLTRPILDKFACTTRPASPCRRRWSTRSRGLERFNQGYATVEYLSSAILDMAMHMLRGRRRRRRRGVRARHPGSAIGAPREVAMRHRLPQFNHLFRATRTPPATTATCGAR